MFFKRLKKRLVFTKRMIRLILPIVFIIPFLKYEKYFIIFVDLIIFILLGLNNIYEKIIYKKYYKKTKNKLKNYKGTIIGICGSYGKTTLKNYIYELLIDKYSVFKTPKSYNTPMGISKCLKNIELYDFLLIEMGISHKGDSKELMNLINPDVVILNNIGLSHLCNFKDFNELKREKLEFLKAPLNFTSQEIFKDNIINYGKYGYIYQDGYVYFEEQKLYKLDVKLNYEILNILGAISIARYYKVEDNYIQSKINNFKKIENRYKEYDYKTFKLIDNSFNNNVDSTFEMLENIKGNKMAIFTDGFVEIDDLYNYLLFNKIYEKFDLILSNNKFFKSDKTYKYKNMKKTIKDISNKYDVILIENDLSDYYRGLL